MSVARSPFGTPEDRRMVNMFARRILADVKRAARSQPSTDRLRATKAGVGLGPEQAEFDKLRSAKELDAQKIRPTPNGDVCMGCGHAGPAPLIHAVGCSYLPSVMALFNARSPAVRRRAAKKSAKRTSP